MIVFKTEHPSKLSYTILVTLVPIVIEVSDEQSRNA